MGSYSCLFSYLLFELLLNEFNFKKLKKVLSAAFINPISHVPTTLLALTTFLIKSYRFYFLQVVISFFTLKNNFSDLLLTLIIRFVQMFWPFQLFIFIGWYVFFFDVATAEKILFLVSEKKTKIWVGPKLNGKFRFFTNLF